MSTPKSKLVSSHAQRYLDMEAVEAAFSGGESTDASEEYPITTPRPRSAASSKKRKGKGKHRIMSSDSESDKEKEDSEEEQVKDSEDESIDGEEKDQLQGKESTQDQVGQRQQSNNSDSSNSAVTNESVMDEIKKGNKLLHSLVKSVREHEKRLQAVEAEVKNAASSTPGATPRRSRTREVPDEVRVSKINEGNAH